jgi:hypothetical protein
MTTDLDPIVGRALGRLVAAVESDPEQTLRRASAAAATLRTRRSARLRRAALLAFVALGLLGGASFAASRFDALPWLNRSDRSSATFSIDASRTYRGPAPVVLVCQDAGAGSFSCSVGALPPRDRRSYLLAERVEVRPQVSRSFVLRALARAERKGQLDHATAEAVRRDVRAVADDFFVALALLPDVETVSSGEGAPGRPGFELVPPSGVPMWIACQSIGSRFRCHDLSASRDVAVGTPLYFLQRSSDWVAAPRQTQRPVDVNGFFHALLGRDLKLAEARLLVEFATLGTTTSGTGSVRRVQARPTKTVSR